MKKLDKEKSLHLLRQMIRIRQFEEKCAELYGMEKIRGFLHLYVGEEAVAAGAIEAVKGPCPKCSIVSTYREHGHALMAGIEMKRVMAEMFGKSTGCSGGRGGSMHLFDAARGFFGGHAIVGAGLPVAVGLAMADKMLGKKNITACFFGDGATAEGSFHESLNLASLWNLPVIFICENNLYAMGTSLKRSHAQTNLSKIASAHLIEAQQIDGMDVEEVHASVLEACKQIQSNGKPQFLELLTYRFRAHSMFDPDIYRPREEVKEWKKRDPIKLFCKKLEERGFLKNGELDELEKAIETEVNEAVDFAESSPWEPVSDLLKNVYTENILGESP